MLRPLGNRLIVKREEAQDTTEGGIILPDISKGKAHRGTVLAVGPGALNDKGERVPVDIKVGDFIYFSSWTDEVQDPDNPKEMLLIVEASSVLGVKE
jgi:chaperonin GroES